MAVEKTFKIYNLLKNNCAPYLTVVPLFKVSPRGSSTML